MLEYLHASREASFEATVISNFNYYTIMEEQNVEQKKKEEEKLIEIGRFSKNCWLWFLLFLGFVWLLMDAGFFAAWMSFFFVGGVIGSLLFIYLWIKLKIGNRFTRKQYWGAILLLTAVDIFLDFVCDDLFETLIGFVASLEPSMLQLHGMLLAEELDLRFLVCLIIDYFPCILSLGLSLSVEIPRAHDFGSSMCIPIIMAVLHVLLVSLEDFGIEEEIATDILLLWVCVFLCYRYIWLGCSDSQKGTNKYGPSLKYPDEEKGESAQV